MYIQDNQIDPLELREYGRNVQNLMRRIQQEPDKERRSEYIKALAPLMIAVNPQLYHNAASIEKVWHDIFVMTDYELDVDVPHQAPKKPSPSDKPVVLPYMKGSLKHKRYGRNILTALEAMKGMDDKAYVEFILVQIAKWILAYHKKNNEIDSILYYFQDVLGKAALPDLAPIKKQLQEFTTHHKNVKYTQKRYFKKRKKG